MEQNKYELQRRVLSCKYADILRGFEETCDDRRIAWNCYQQIIGACEAMRDSGMENNFVCCAVNKSIREQETEIDEIITRFTGKVYRGVRWVKPEEEEQHQEWGLVMVVPKAVDDSMADMGKKTSFGKEKTGGWRDAYRALGYQDGKQFDPTSRLADTPERAAIGG